MPTRWYTQYDNLFSTQLIDSRGDCVVVVVGVYFPEGGYKVFIISGCAKWYNFRIKDVLDIILHSIMYEVFWKNDKKVWA